MEQDKNTLKQLENLLLSEDLEQLNLKTKQFNIFNALKLQNAEIRHSNFLGWLMAPYETHELGDYFLKEFLKLAIKDYSIDDKTDVCLKDIVFYDLSDVEIRREYKNIDILVISPKNKFICIVENKIWTGEHDNQLERYSNIVNTEFQDYKKLYIYLAPNNVNELIDRTSICETYYIPMTYKQVFKAIDKTLRFKAKSLSDEVKIFIEHYKNMIERNIMRNTDKEIIDLCRKIYRENKVAIDLIIENNDHKADVLSIMTDILKARDDIEQIHIEKDCIIFLPNKINNINQFKYGAWTDDLIVYLHFMSFSHGHKDACIEILLGPVKNKSDNDKKQKLIAKIEEKTGLAIKGNDWNYTEPFSIMTYEEYLRYENEQEIRQHIENKFDMLKTKFIDDLRIALNEI